MYLFCLFQSWYYSQMTKGDQVELITQSTIKRSFDKLKKSVSSHYHCSLFTFLPCNCLLLQTFELNLLSLSSCRHGVQWQEKQFWMFEVKFCIYIHVPKWCIVFLTQNLVVTNLIFTVLPYNSYSQQFFSL